MINQCVFLGTVYTDPMVMGENKGAKFLLKVDKDKNYYTLVPVKMWGKTFERHQNSVKKGVTLSLTGSFDVSTYEKNGEKVYDYSINAYSINYPPMDNSKSSNDVVISDDDFPF